MYNALEDEEINDILFPKYEFGPVRAKIYKELKQEMTDNLDEEIDALLAGESDLWDLTNLD